MQSAIVPMSQSSLAAAVADAAGNAMRNIDAGDVAVAARKVQGAFRRWARKTGKPSAKRRRTGKYKMQPRVMGASNYSQGKADLVPFGPDTQVQMGILNVNDFPWPAWVGSSATLGERLTNKIFLKGLKLCRQFEYTFNANTPDVGLIEVNWALVQLKNDEDNTELAAELGVNFFRDNFSAAERSQDFNQYITSSQWSMQLNCLAINPNNKINILARKKKILAPGFDVALGQKGHPSFWKIEEYMPIKKFFTFKSTTDTLPNQRLIELHWYNTVSASKFPADPTVIKHIGTNKMHTVYYGNSI